MPSPLKLGAAFTLLMGGLAGAQSPVSNGVTAVRHWSLGDVTRVVIETRAEFEFTSERVAQPDRVFFDLPDTGVRLGRRGVSTFPVNDLRLKQIRVAETVPGTARIVFDLENGVEYSASMLSNPPRLIVELRRSADMSARDRPPEPLLSDPPDPVLSRPTAPPAAASIPVATAPVPPPVRSGIGIAPSQTASTRHTAPHEAAIVTPPASRRTSTPQPAKLGTSQSMTRVLGLKIGRIVLDPGHGGHDTGTPAPAGLLEKDLVLDVARRLGTLIEKRLGAEVVYTRTDDTFIPLERRTEIANESRADLFLSIHANSSPEPSASGVETYYLNFTSSHEAMEVAARENASSQKTVYELKDLLQKIALQDKVEESRQFADRIQRSVYGASVKSNSRTKNRGVRRAPFVVLIGASMPSVLAEIGFLSNPRDEALFRKAAFRQKIAEGLFQGISRYASTLSQFQVAKN